MICPTFWSPPIHKHCQVERAQRSWNWIFCHHPFTSAAKLKGPRDHGIEFCYRHCVFKEKIWDNERGRSWRRKYSRHIAYDPRWQLSLWQKHSHWKDDAKKSEWINRKEEWAFAATRKGILSSPSSRNQSADTTEKSKELRIRNKRKTHSAIKNQNK